jgi:NADPH:quinone reductase-like Zn-dependent oxidoreductase
VTADSNATNSYFAFSVFSLTWGICSSLDTNPIQSKNIGFWHTFDTGSSPAFVLSPRAAYLPTHRSIHNDADSNRVFDVHFLRFRVWHTGGIMKAAIITAAGRTPVYGDFKEPVAREGMELIAVSASALSQFSKARSSGLHYSSDGAFPTVAGADGVGRTADGRRVYFVLPEPPFGALAEESLVHPQRCVAVPDSVDDVTAAAIANPGMSAWAGLVERARLRPGENVLVNGATGTAGRLAVQLARHLGAGKVIATGRNESELQELLALGADRLIPFKLSTADPRGAKQYEQELITEFTQAIDVVIDYLWGESAKTVIVAIAKAVEDARPVRFVHVGGASGEESIQLPGAALRSSAIQLMGSGVKSVPFPKLLDAIKNVFDVVVPAGLQVQSKAVPLSAIEETWDAPGNRASCSPFRRSAKILCSTLLDRP